MFTSNSGKNRSKYPSNTCPPLHPADSHVNPINKHKFQNGKRKPEVSYPRLLKGLSANYIPARRRKFFTQDAVKE
jgi:hypothetical protein